MTNEKCTEEKKPDKETRSDKIPSLLQKKEEAGDAGKKDSDTDSSVKRAGDDKKSNGQMKLELSAAGFFKKFPDVTRARFFA